MSDSGDSARMCECFNSKLSSIINNKKQNSTFLSKEKYTDLIEKVSESKLKTSGKKPEDYQRLKRYDVINVGEVDKLIYPRKNDGGGIRFYAHTEELFPIIHKAHLAIGHGGRNRMLKELQKNYKNITIEAVMIYLSLCERCQKNFKMSRKNLGVRPGIFQEMNSRCQIDFIDMQFEQDDEFKFILVYMDYLTKFLQLRPLKTKHEQEVANVLIDIFCIFGAPSVLISHSDPELSNRIIGEACSIWVNLKIVNEEPINVESTGFVEDSSHDIKSLLRTWLEGSQTSKWSKGLRFIQLMKNKVFNTDMKCSPYDAMFGSHSKVNPATLSLPNPDIPKFDTKKSFQEQIEPLIDENTTENVDSHDLDDSNLRNSFVFLNDDQFGNIAGSSSVFGVLNRQEDLTRKRVRTEEGLEENQVKKTPAAFDYEILPVEVKLEELDDD